MAEERGIIKGLYIPKETDPEAFTSRRQAGELLAEKLSGKVEESAVVLGILHGGLVVAEPIAHKYNLPLNFITVKKLRAPGNPELAIGAIAPDNNIFIDYSTIQSNNAGKKYIEREIAVRTQELITQEEKLRQTIPTPDLKNRPVILVDDGIATGSSIAVALIYLKKQAVGKIILAAPIVAEDSAQGFRADLRVEACIFLKEIPVSTFAVGDYYQDFTQVSDEEVIAILSQNQ